MDLEYAIERHRQPLLVIVASLYAMIGLTESGTIERLARPLYRLVLALLRPAESAVRRLIVVAAQGLVMKARPARRRPAGPVRPRKRNTQSRRSFRLFDPRTRQVHCTGRRFTSSPRVEPRIRLLGDSFDPRVPEFLRPLPPQPEPNPKSATDHTVNAVSLCRRLAAILDALKDLPRQAKRYARLQAIMLNDPHRKRNTVLRPGPPSGLRRKSSHEVHKILSECHWLARTVTAPNSS